MSARIIVHSLEHAQAAVAAAAALDRPVILESAPGAGVYAGAPWFLALVAAASAAYPGAPVDSVLDCADEPGTVLAALRAGQKQVRFTGSVELRLRLAEIAAAQGALIEDEAAGPALDLLGVREPEAACRDWLAGGGTGA